MYSKQNRYSKEISILYSSYAEASEKVASAADQIMQEK